MSTHPLPKELWLDVLHEKHECYTHKALAEKEVTVSGQTVTLVLPSYFARFDVRAAAADGDVLFVFGRQQEAWDRDEHLGVVVLARRVADDVFHAHLWHETYPYVFKYLTPEQE